MRICLLFGDGQASKEGMDLDLGRAGYEVRRIPYAQAQWACAESAKDIALVGCGSGCREALLLAERYPVGALVLIGCPLRPRREGFARAERDLFSIVADLMIVQPRNDPEMRPRGTELILRSVGSGHVEKIEMGEKYADLWTNCKIPLLRAVLNFLGASERHKELAKIAKS